MVMGNKWLSDDSHYVFDLYRWPVKQDSNNIICPLWALIRVFELRPADLL